jgi:hypothetical protein
MIKKYIIETLTKIKKINETVHLLYTHGVDLIEFDNGVALLEKSIPLIIRRKEDEAVEWIDNLVGWWLYDESEKIITVDGDVKINLEKVEDFADYLISEYLNYESCSL